MTPSRPTISTRKRGFVLVVVLWGLVLLGLVVLALGRSVSSHVKVTANAVSSARAEALADAGVAIAILDITAQRLSAGHRRRFRLDGTAVACEMAGAGRIAIGIEDEAGRVDLNTASEPLLALLFQAAGAGPSQAEELAARLADYRDGDDTPRFAGAERSDYSRHGLPHEPRNGPLLSVDELSLVAGVTPQMASRARTLATVASGLNGIDPEAAPLALLEALSQSAGAIALGSRVAAAADGRRRDFQIPAGTVARSTRRAFTIRVAARTSDGAVFVREAQAEFPSPRPGLHRIVGWRRGRDAPDTAHLPEPAPPC